MLEEFRDHNNNIRKLGLKPTPKGMLRSRGATNIREWRLNAGLTNAVIPRNQWKATSFTREAPDDLIEDQRSYGACSCATETGAQNRQRWMRGRQYEPLSWCWLYDQVNGGQDSGSNMGEATGVARRVGVPPMASYSDCRFTSGIKPPNSLWYREGQDEVTFSSFEEIVTGILMGILVQHAIDARVLGQFTGDGVAVGNCRSGNHSVYAAGLAQVNDEWVLADVNSWRLEFGPFRKGWCYVTERQINDIISEDEAVGHIVVENPR